MTDYLILTITETTSGRLLTNKSDNCFGLDCYSGALHAEAQSRGVLPILHALHHLPVKLLPASGATHVRKSTPMHCVKDVQCTAESLQNQLVNRQRRINFTRPAVDAAIEVPKIFEAKWG